MLQAPLIQSLKTGVAPVVIEAPQTAHVYLLTQVVRRTAHAVVHVLPQDKDIEVATAICRYFAPDVELLQLPAWDTLPYDRVGPSHAITSARLKCLTALAMRERQAAKPYILFTSIHALTQKLPPRTLFSGTHFTLRTNKPLQREALFHFLQANAYQRVGKVMEAGEYAVRGSLIDLFPAGSEYAIRIDLIGDEIESLKSFDPLTQISDQAVESVTLGAVHEILLQPETISRFRTRYLEQFGAITRDDPLYESVSAGRSYAGMEHWLPLFFEHLDTLSDYCEGALFSTDHRLETLVNERFEAVEDYYQARKAHQHQKGALYNPVTPESLYLNYETLLHHWRTHARLTLTPFAVTGAHKLAIQLSPQLFNRRHAEGQPIRDVVLDYLRGAELPVILAANSPGSADRIGKMLATDAQLQISADTPDTDSQEALEQSIRGLANVRLTVLPIEHGFITPEFILLSEQDMFGERIIRTQKRRRKSEAFLAEAASFIEGELIVHREHGIGRFEGLVTVEVGHARHDCLKLIYDGDAKLFLPVENIDLISRFGTADGPVVLDKLGGVAWQKRRSALKKRLKMAAEALIKVAAERAAIAAPTLTAESESYDEFIARFPYSETEDQLMAIEEVRTDLASGRVMDRLVCGDVGFGKTEVALRAAFIAVSSGQQVAVIAPTTLLARQHYRTFSERFHSLPRRERAGVGAELAEGSELTSSGSACVPPHLSSPLRGQEFSIRHLSRMTSAKEALETKALLPEGKVDIVIGTHALLSKNVSFKNLGLLIVDEEQHFGVVQKEKLKQLRSAMHVLTLSATPIPRTLQLSLSGVRELSLITTPPVDRLAVRTYVMPWDPVVLREAILREYHRGGKVFVVTPRIKYMTELQQKLSELVPEVKIATAHGQMGAVTLDKVMNEFYDGKYDVLLSTSIIESGIDIPIANTIIIDRADQFGLSQLYQLRGRVGRSKTRAYAYLTLPHGKTLSREAQRRLEVMQQLDTLGAGFQLASHDMDIRGYGNLLGEEQSGHVKEVGIELYQAMLEEAIAEMKTKKQMPRDEDTPEGWSPQINLGMSVLIPESYVEDLSLRLSLYRRAAGLTSNAELESFAAELTDRFGTLPTELEHLLATLRIKLMCKISGIARLDVGPKGVVLAFRNNKFANPPALIDHIAKHAARIKLRADQTLFIAAEPASEPDRLRIAEGVVREVLGLLG